MIAPKVLLPLLFVCSAISAISVCVVFCICGHERDRDIKSPLIGRGHASLFMPVLSLAWILDYRQPRMWAILFYLFFLCPLRQWLLLA